MSTTWRMSTEIPGRFLLLAGVLVVAVFWFTMSVLWDPTGNDAHYGAPSFISRLGSVQGMVAVLLASLPLLALRWPVVAGLIGLLPFLFFVVVPFTDRWPFGLFVAVVGAAMVGMWSRPRQAVVTAALALVPVTHCALGASTMLLPDHYDIRFERADPVVLLVYVVATALLLAAAWWMRRSALEALGAAQLRERASDVERTSAVVEERARLARDLHDVVAHHVSLIAVRAETAPYAVPELAPPARELFSQIAGDARQALDELRGVLGVLRRSVDAADRVPQPAAAQIPSLVEQARAAGDVVVWSPTDLADVPAPAGYAAYRVVQEALTNARRHAPGTSVQLTTALEGDAIHITVTNPAPVDSLVEGRGLAGMRERVESLGGRLTARATGDAFVLEVVIPTAGAA